MTKHEFVESLRIYRGVLPKQSLRTLKGQALSGNVKGAEKGLKKLKENLR